MFMFFFTIITLSLGITIVITDSLVILGMWIIMLSVSISVICGSMFYSWFSFIMFLIYIGGMLVMFAYFVAIQPNQYFNISSPSYWFFLTTMNLPINSYLITSDLFFNHSWWISSMFYINNISMIIILGFVLFLALISVVKVTLINIAPLRPFKYV